MICRRMERRSSLADLHFADLNCRRDVGVIGNVGHDLLGVRAERAAEGLDRIEIEMAHGGEAGLGAGGAAFDAVLDRDLLACRAEFFLPHRHVLLAVIIDVELAALVARVEHAHLDHGFPPYCDGFVARMERSDPGLFDPGALRSMRATRRYRPKRARVRAAGRHKAPRAAPRQGPQPAHVWAKTDTPDRSRAHRPSAQTPGSGSRRNPRTGAGSSRTAPASNRCRGRRGMPASLP